jgi:hypothetical protein
VAISLGKTDVVSALLESDNLIDVDACLHMSVRFFSSLDIVRMLLARGASPLSVNEIGDSVFTAAIHHYAAAMEVVASARDESVVGDDGHVQTPKRNIDSDDSGRDTDSVCDDVHPSEEQEYQRCCLQLVQVLLEAVDTRDRMEMLNMRRSLILTMSNREPDFSGFGSTDSGVATSPIHVTSPNKALNRTSAPRTPYAHTPKRSSPSRSPSNSIGGAPGKHQLSPSRFPHCCAGFGCLQIAVAHRCTSLVDLLLENGAEVNSRETSGDSCLAQVCTCANCELFLSINLNFLSIRHCNTETTPSV